MASKKPYYLATEKVRRQKGTFLQGRGLYWGYRIPETISQRIGAAIQYRRAEMHLTQAGFAEMVGVSEKFVGMVEREGNASMSTLEAMVEAMGMKPDHFLLLAAGFTPHKPPVTPKSLPASVKAAEVAADALERLVGVLDAVLNDVKTRLEDYYKSIEKPEK